MSPLYLILLVWFVKRACSDNSSLISIVTFAHSGANKLTTNRSYDYLYRLTEVDNLPTGSGGNSNVAYTYNDRNQRTRATRADATYWSYGYDSNGNLTGVGQVGNASVSLANGTILPGTDTAYTYDSIGNRKTITANGANSTLTSVGNYYANTTGNGTVGANLLNEVGSRDIPRKLSVFGVVAANSTVAVNGNTAIITGNVNWFGSLPFAGNNSAQWAAMNITANLGSNTSTETGNLYLAPNPEAYAYDADGNLLSDSRWNYIWDGENRLAALVTSDIAATAGVPRQAIVFAYDSMNRKVLKKVYDWNASGAGTWVITEAVAFLYDGFNLVAEINQMPATPTTIRTYAWGPDLSGSMQGAGGVGGLLMANLNDGNGTNQMVYYGYDGNGNVITLVAAANNTVGNVTAGDVVANYDYDAFGNSVRKTGYWAAFNPIRFSTKYNEMTGTYAGKDVGLDYYGERFYSPGLGRFASRDPVEELGGLNLYAIGGNNLVDKVDATGLWTLDNYLTDATVAWMDYLNGVHKLDAQLANRSCQNGTAATSQQSLDFANSRYQLSGQTHLNPPIFERFGWLARFLSGGG